MMAATPPPRGGDAPDSRDQRDMEESMEVELALSAHALLSWGRGGIVHLDGARKPVCRGFSLFPSLVVQVEMCRPRG